MHEMVRRSEADIDFFLAQIVDSCTVLYQLQRLHGQYFFNPIEIR